MPRNNYVTWSGDPLVRWLTDKELWRLEEPFTATWHRPGHEGWNVLIEPGFEFDGSSIPLRLQSFISAQGKHFRSSLPHDHLYEPANRALEEARTGIVWSKDNADLFFKDGLETDGMDEQDEYLMYKAVQRFGGSMFEN